MNWVAVGNAGLFALFGVFLAFVVLYLHVAGWWRTEMGRHIMAFMASCLLTIGVRVSRVLWPGWPGYYALRAICAWLVVVMVAWRIAILIRAQIARRHR